MKLWLLHWRKELLVVVAHMGCTIDSLLSFSLILGCILRTKKMRCRGSVGIRYHAVAGASTGSLIGGWSVLWDAEGGVHVRKIRRVRVCIGKPISEIHRDTHGPEP